MPDNFSLRSAAIRAYRYLTWPIRYAEKRHVTRNGTVPVHVLFYHRGCDHTPNGWTMSNASFEKQVLWLVNNFDVVSLAEAQQRIRSRNTRPTACITFDDGYADNSLQVLPFLIKRKIPFTYFVCLQNLLTGEPFQHDLDEGKPLDPHDLDSIRMLAKTPTVEIGAHTRNHTDIASITDEAVLIDELVTSTRELEAHINQPVRYFAFPFGLKQNLTTDAFHLLKANGIEGVCSAYGGLNEIGGDAFHIQRLHGDPNFDRIVNWLTYDPRVKRKTRFEYLSAKIPLQLIQQCRELKPIKVANIPAPDLPVPTSAELENLDGMTSAAIAPVDTPTFNVVFPPSETS